MKTISSKSIAIFAATFALIFAVMPIAQSFAVEGNGDSNGNGGSAVCRRLATLDGTGRATVAAQRATMESDFATRLLTISSDKATIDQRVLDARTSANTAFEAKIADLKATEGLTEDQLTAIDTYQTNMQTAETARETAVDAARTTYRTALRSTIQERQTTLTTTVESYQASVNTALMTAKENCGTDSNVMATLRVAVKTAREDLNTVRQGAQVGDDVKALVATRNDAIKTANETFATLAKTYTETLTAALQTTA